MWARVKAWIQWWLSLANDYSPEQEARDRERARKHFGLGGGGMPKDEEPGPKGEA